MPVISRNDSIAANTRSQNLLDGEQFEFISAPSLIALHLAAAAAGLTIDFFVGGEAQAVALVPPATNRFPIRPDDMIARIGGLPGERLALFATNTTGAAIVLNTLLDIDR